VRDAEGVRSMVRIHEAAHDRCNIAGSVVGSCNECERLAGGIRARAVRVTAESASRVTIATSATSCERRHGQAALIRRLP